MYSARITFSKLSALKYRANNYLVSVLYWENDAQRKYLSNKGADIGKPCCTITAKHNTVTTAFLLLCP